MQKTGTSCRALSKARPQPLRCSDGHTVLDLATSTKISVHGPFTPRPPTIEYVSEYFSDVAAYLRSVGAQTGDSLVDKSLPQAGILSAASSGDVKAVAALLLVDPASVHQRGIG
jgi:hypothetical protein